MEQMTGENKHKGVPWFRNFKWWVVLIISFIAWILYSANEYKGGTLWYIIFLVSFIFSIKQFLKEDYFKLSAKKKSTRIYNQILIAIIFIISLIVVSAITRLIFK